MPFNSFENYPMSWRPRREELEKPYYLSLAGLLEREIAEGRLKAHTKLPPQRELADFLDLNVSTITRAYKLCELKGLLYAVTGRGTFVASGICAGDTFIEKKSHCIEMGMIKPFYETNDMVLEAARVILKRGDAARLLEYSSPLGTDRQLCAAACWLQRHGVHVEKRGVLIAAGAQNVLSVILISLFQAGDKIAVDEFTYTNFKGLANLLQIQLIAVRGDNYGMLPEALEMLCKNSEIRGVYLMPTCSNPTGVFIPQDRRKELAKVMRRYCLLLIEDDIYSFLAPQGTDSFFSFIPEQTLHICSLSKSLCAGMRVAFVAFSEQYRDRLVTGMLHINLKTVALNAEIMAELIESGKADEIVRRKIELAEKRNRIYERFFRQEEGNIARFFHWLKLPSGLTSEEAELLALQNGVHVLGSHRFAQGGGESAAFLRLSVVSTDTETELAQGLKILQNILQEPPVSLLV